MFKTNTLRLIKRDIACLLKQNLEFKKTLNFIISRSTSTTGDSSNSVYVKSENGEYEDTLTVPAKTFQEMRLSTLYSMGIVGHKYKKGIYRVTVSTNKDKAIDEVVKEARVAVGFSTFSLIALAVVLATFLAQF